MCSIYLKNGFFVEGEGDLRREKEMTECHMSFSVTFLTLRDDEFEGK